MLVARFGTNGEMHSRVPLPERIHQSIQPHLLCGTPVNVKVNHRGQSPQLKIYLQAVRSSFPRLSCLIERTNSTRGLRLNPLLSEVATRSRRLLREALPPTRLVATTRSLSTAVSEWGKHILCTPSGENLQRSLGRVCYTLPLT